MLLWVIWSYFLDLTLKVKEIQIKINKWDTVKFKSFCTAKEAINKKKKQPTRWKKILTTDMTHEGLISKI